jgi:hypothetical protein
MTKYTVLWDADLERDFIDSWARSDSRTRAVLTEIANRVDALLSVSPQSKGIKEAESIRLLDLTTAAAKASVAYQVLDKHRQVRVIRLTFRTSE